MQDCNIVEAHSALQVFLHRQEHRFMAKLKIKKFPIPQKIKFKDKLTFVLGKQEIHTL